MVVPRPIVEAVEDHTGAKVRSFNTATGGCINNGGKLTTSLGTFFLKWNDRSRLPGMFDVESKGLDLLRRSDALVVPKVVRSGAAGAYQFLLLEYIEDGRPSEDYWRSLGRGLAALHRESSPTFGLDYDNYIGSLRQRNTPASSWLEFFIECRLEAQLRLALDSKAIEQRTFAKFTKLFNRLPSLIPEEPPSLLHGDLWGGNVMTTAEGQPCLIDPAVYYGHREVDLAMTQLFGGFDPAFFKSYDDAYPLTPGYRERLDLYNLYPLLVHVNLFGGGYSAQVVSILEQYV